MATNWRAKIFISKDGDRFLVPGYWHEADDVEARSSFDAFMFATICDCTVAPGWLEVETNHAGIAALPNQPYDIRGRQFAHGGISVMLIGGPVFEECWRTDHPDEPIPTNPLTDAEADARKERAPVDFTGLDAALDELRKPVDEVRE